MIFIILWVRLISLLIISTFKRNSNQNLVMDWKEKGDKLTKEFELRSFSHIVQRLEAVANTADAMNHHPDFSVHGYNKIKFELTTHSEKRVTEKDYALARQIDTIMG